jgi:hypothetical protein
MSLRSGKLPFLGSEDEFFTIRDITDPRLKGEIRGFIKPPTGVESRQLEDADCGVQPLRP